MGPMMARESAQILVGAAVAVVLGLVAGAATSISVVVAVAVLVAAAMAPLLWRFPAQLALLGVVAAVVLSGLARGLPIPAARLSEVGVVVAGMTLFSAKARTLRPRWRAVDWCLAAYAGLHFLLPVGNGLRGVAPSPSMDDVVRAAGPMMFLVVFRVVRTYAFSAQWRQRLVRWFLATCIAVSLIGVAQAAHVPGVEQLLATATDTEALFQSREYSRQARATSTFGHWHPFAGYLVVMAVLSLAVLLQRHHNERDRRLAAVAGGCAVLALISTVTVAAVLGLVLAVIVVAVRHARQASALLVRALPFGIVAAIIMWPSISLRIQNQFGFTTTSGLPAGLDFRVRIWSSLVDALRGHWLVGYGIRLPSNVAWQYTENQYFTLLLRGGAVLLVMFVALCIVAAIRIQRAGREGGAEGKVYADTVVATVTAMLAVMFWIAPYFTFPGLTVLFWSVVALSMEVDRHESTCSPSKQQAAPVRAGGGAGDRTVDQLSPAGA